jgi:hypothetical protein
MTDEQKCDRAMAALDKQALARVLAAINSQEMK